MLKVRKKKEAGFTLIEMLITVLIIGVLAAMSIAGYFGYVKTAKTAEAKAVIGSVWTALQGCAMLKPGTICPIAASFGPAGLNGGVTPDGRWTITGGDTSIAAATNILSLTSDLIATGAEDVAGIIVQMSYDNAASPPGSFRCTIPPAAISPC